MTQNLTTYGCGLCPHIGKLCKACERNAQFDRQRAMTEMREGKKVRYHTWYWGHYIYIRKGGNIVVDHRGYEFAASEILTMEKGWEVYDEHRHGAHNEQR